MSYRAHYKRKATRGHVLKLDKRPAQHRLHQSFFTQRAADREFPFTQIFSENEVDMGFFIEACMWLNSQVFRCRSHIFNFSIQFGSIHLNTYIVILNDNVRVSDSGDHFNRIFNIILTNSTHYMCFAIYTVNTH